jgi:group I intron endonuclease
MHLYVLTNQVNDKRYVGQTVNDLDIRIGHHRLCHVDCAISRAVKKHGWDNFDVQTCAVDTLDELNELEEFMIQDLDSHVSKHGYNVKMGGDNHAGMEHTTETKAKISNALTGKVRTPEMIEAMRERQTGYKHSAEARAKVSVALTGRPVSAETRAKMSASQKGHPPMPPGSQAMRVAKLRGRKHSAEHKAKISAGLVVAWAKRRREN